VLFGLFDDEDALVHPVEQPNVLRVGKVKEVVQRRDVVDHEDEGEANEYHANQRQ